MNETLNEAAELLGRLQFETGGALLDDIVALRRKLLAERQQRVDELRRAGMTDAEIGLPSTDATPPETVRFEACRRNAS